MSTSDRSCVAALLQSLSSGSMDAQTFCEAFEVAYNFEIEKDQLTPLERTALGELFELVVRYSPFEDERVAIGYIR